MTPEESAAQNKRVLKVGNEPLAAPEKKLDLNVEADRQEAIVKTKEEMRTLKNKTMSANIMYVRRMAAKILKMARRSTYFQENNHADAIATMMSSGLGRVGRRQLQKKLMMPWKDYKDSEEAIIAGGEYEISKACAKGLRLLSVWYESQGWTDIRDKTSFSEKTKFDIITVKDELVTGVVIRKHPKESDPKKKKILLISPGFVYHIGEVMMIRKAK
jgi:hypothetical protein